MLEINWGAEALSDLDKIDNFISSRIIKKVETLRENFSGIKRLSNSEFFRLRVGDYRIIFLFDGKLVTIFKIGHRKNIYKGL